MATVFYNIGNLITLWPAARRQARGFFKESDLGIIHNGAFAVKNGKLAWVGAANELPKTFKKNKKVNLNGATVLPAFIECHTHGIFAGDRAQEFEKRNQGMSYQEIAKAGGGILSTVRATRQMSEKDLAKNFSFWVNEFLGQGVTTLEVKSGYSLDLDGEVKMLKVAGKKQKVRVVPTFLGPHALAPEFKSSSEYVDFIIEKALPKIKKSKLAKRVDIFIEDGYFTLEDGKRYIEAARQLGFEFCIHADQLTRTGAAILGAELGAKSVDHVLQVSSSDIKSLGKSNTTCVLLPTADFYLKCAYPKAIELLEANARIAIATDFNPGSSPSTDLMFAGLLARTHMGLSLPQVIVAYTLGAAYALGFEATLGSLEKGKDADFLVLRGEKEELFYHVGYSPVTQAWTRGQKIFQKKLDN